MSSSQFGYAGARLALAPPMGFDRGVFGGKHAAFIELRKAPPPPVITDLYFYALAVPAVICLGLSKGGFAAFGSISTPLLALYLPPLEAAAIVLPLLITQDMISVWNYRKDWSRWNFRVLLTGAVVGIGAAWLVAAHVSDNAVRITVGLIGVAFVANAWWGKKPATIKPPTAAKGVFWGALSGFTSTMSQAGGPPFQVFVLPQQLPKMTLVGTSTVFFAAVNALKVIPYFALGQFSPKGLATSVVLLPVAVAANMLGIWLVRITPTELFYRIAYWMVLFISCGLLWQGISHALAG
ncbi:sulfite exporter TauE/SafE family protein [Xanthobacteraceae bacterium Astr-EGSB]|uniref:sulfite exporter TauE/SafE family protein n=1 Tax=Astrobacterium formosum TaxID=3069710 RepID=UPI0027B47AFE|nr:sulfite exporter TauE/SafE family protein [Xanthobacteraceae bacterium Astr-EGSB]